MVGLCMTHRTYLPTSTYYYAIKALLEPIVDVDLHVLVASWRPVLTHTHTHRGKTCSPRENKMCIIVMARDKWASGQVGRSDPLRHHMPMPPCVGGAKSKVTSVGGKHLGVLDGIRVWAAQRPAIGVPQKGSTVPGCPSQLV